VTNGVGPFAAHGPRSRLFLVLLALIAVTLLAVGSHVIGAFDRAVAPELNKRTRLIGTIVRTELQRALELGQQLDAMAGLESYLSTTIDKFGEVDAIVVRAADGTTIAAAHRPAKGGPAAGVPVVPVGVHTVVERGSYVLPILDRNRLVGEIQIDTSPTFVRTRLREVFLDVMVIALVATLLAVELTLMVIAASVTGPQTRVLHLLDAQRGGDFRQVIRSRGLGGLSRTAARLSDHAEDLAERWTALSAAARARVKQSLDGHIAIGRPALLRLSDVGDIRLPLFIYVIASEVAVAFLPIYARALVRPDWLTPAMAAALPLVCYLVAAAVLTPFSGRLSRKFGSRNLFLWSIPATVVSLAALAMATQVLEVALWRGVMAVFYATATIACQEYALGASVDAGSTRPMGAFVAVVYGGVFCGAALGGVIAGRFGFQAALLSGAAAAVVAGILGAVTLRGTSGDPIHDAATAGSPTSWRLDIRIAALLLGLAVPMSATTAVFVWYLTPLVLTESGSGPAEVARVVMLYYLAIVLFGPAVIAASDGRVGPRTLVVLGASIAGFGLLSLSLWSGFWAVTAAMAVLGIGHTVMRAPLYAWVRRVDPGGTSIMPLRLSERIGAILGLGICALFLPVLGSEFGIRWLAIITLVGVVAFVAIDMLAPRRPS
jgi:MFS family permease